MKNQKLIDIFEKRFNKKITQFNVYNWLDVSQSQNPYLSPSFIREFKDKVNWFYISKCQKLSGNFIKEFDYIVIWQEIFTCQKLSGSCINKYKNNYSIFYWSKYNKISLLKYDLKHNKITNKEYLRELLLIQNA